MPGPGGTGDSFTSGAELEPGRHPGHASPRATRVAGPVRYNSVPGPFQAMVCVPPGATTRSGDFARPSAMAAVAAAELPVPEDEVGPTPRSQMRISTSLGPADTNKLDVGLVRKVAEHAHIRSHSAPAFAIDLESHVVHKDDEVRIAGGYSRSVQQSASLALSTVFGSNCGTPMPLVTSTVWPRRVSIWHSCARPHRLQSADHRQASSQAHRPSRRLRSGCHCR